MNSSIIDHNGTFDRDYYSTVTAMCFAPHGDLKVTLYVPGRRLTETMRYTDTPPRRALAKTTIFDQSAVEAVIAAGPVAPPRLTATSPVLPLPLSIKWLLDVASVQPPPLTFLASGAG